MARGSITQASVATPLGFVHVHARDEQLVSVTIDAAPADVDATATPLLREAGAQLVAWFAGRLQCFDLPLAPAATPRGSALRAAIAAVPFGGTARYGELAHAIGSSPRAVGQACARNPFPILIPCHRVLAANGLERYSAGQGTPTKSWLLAHEARHALTGDPHG